MFLREVQDILLQSLPIINKYLWLKSGSLLNNLFSVVIKVSMTRTIPLAIEVRAMLCFDTQSGKKCNVYETDKNFRLPTGCDSAYGVPGVSLNYPELMLYNADAGSHMYHHIQEKRCLPNGMAL